jgi:DNA-binding XRE family transcriptional regulator
VVIDGYQKEKTARIRRVENWRAAEFLGLNDEEAAIVELKLGLTDAVRDNRTRRRLTQEQLGKLLGLSQSRVAKIEAADRSVSIDLMVRSLIRMGASRKELASYIAAPARRRAA